MRCLWKNIKTTLILVLYFYISQINAKTFDCTNLLDSVPEKDRDELELLFHDLITTSQFGYTIFGDKPVSIKGYFITTPFGNLLRKNKIDNTKKYWETWRHYQHLFPMKNYLLFDEETPNDNLRAITLINIKSFKEKFNQHALLFKNRLGQDVTANKLINLLRDQKAKGLFNMLNQDEELYGILLGYGKKSSSIFKRFFELDSYLNPLYQTQFSIKWPKISESFDSLNEEYEFLRKQLTEPKPDHILSSIQSVCFMAVKNDSEAQLLQDKYKKDRRKLSNIYKNNSFLFTSLEKLCASN